MKRHLNRKKDRLKEIDPGNVAFWESLFSTPCTVLLAQDPFLVPYLADMEGHPISKANTKGTNACVLRKQTVHENASCEITISRDIDMITAFYFPLIAGLREVRLTIGGVCDIRWTPEGAEPSPLPLHAILEECRSVPGSEICWDRILEGCGQKGDYPVMYHDFGRDLEIDGEKYRRAVLLHPCIPMVGFLPSQEIQLVFELEEPQTFAFYQEEWHLNPTTRTHLSETSRGTVGFRLTIGKSALIPELSRDAITQRALVDFGALQASARPFVS